MSGMKNKIAMAIATAGIIGFSGTSMADTTIPMDLNLTFDESCVVTNNNLSFNNGNSSFEDYTDPAVRNYEIVEGVFVPQLIASLSGTVEIACSAGADVEIDMSTLIHTVAVGGESLELRFAARDTDFPTFFSLGNSTPLTFTSTGAVKEILVYGALYRTTPSDAPLPAGTISENYTIDVTFN